MAKKDFDQEKINEYLKITGAISCSKSDKKNQYLITRKDGSQYLLHFSKILQYVEYKNSKPSLNDFNNLPKKIKKEWRHVSASITLDEYTKLEAIAKKNNIKINQILRSIILKVIEVNK